MTPCPPPHPNPSPPRLSVPPGACDCHAHVFGPAGRYRYATERDYTPPDAPLERYRRLLATLGVERAVLVQPSVYGTDNTAVLDALAATGERFRGVAVLPPDTPERELERLHAAGVRGVRINLVTRGGGVPLDDLERMAARIAPLGWHVQLFVTLGTLADAAPRLAALPRAPVVDHMGAVPAGTSLQHPGFQALLRLAGEGRCWVKLSGAYRLSAEDVPYADVVPYAQALVAANPERMVWGSDWPHPILHDKPMPDDGALVDLLADWAPDEAVRRRILVDNPAELYGFA